MDKEAREDEEKGLDDDLTAYWSKKGDEDEEGMETGKLCVFTAVTYYIIQLYIL